MKIAFAHIRSGIDGEYYNLGDKLCCPAWYKQNAFAGHKIEEKDWRDNLGGFDIVIFGGGGLFMGDSHEYIGRIAEEKPVIIWGAGLNYDADQYVPGGLVDALKKCMLVGVRDARFAEVHNFEHVPCASCLNPSFEQAHPEERPADPCRFFFYLSKPEECPYPALPLMSNREPGASPEEFRRNVLRAHVTVTDSYHGAYWASLIGAPVVLWNVHGGRFATGLYANIPMVSSAGELEHLVDYGMAARYPGYAHYCQSANHRFSGQIQQFLRDFKVGKKF